MNTPTKVQAREESSNAYDPLIAPGLSNAIERTQIGRFHTKGGTGFAAEEANAAADRWAGKPVEQVGTSNEVNGADRISDGIHIQTKYFESAARTVDAAFDEKGLFRYGTQQLEVPSDQYEESLERMRAKIAAGKVPGVTDPRDADKIVKKGDVTYRQARNIARSGNVDSLMFDAKAQAVTTMHAAGLSFLINFARLKWDGKTTVEATKEAIAQGLASGLTSFVTGVAASQILRTRSAAAAVPFMRSGVNMAYSTDLGKVAVQKVASASLGKTVAGAAAKNHVAKLLRTNVVTGVITTVVVSTPDFYRAAFDKSISWAQFSKNAAVTGAGVAGGAGGWMAGAALGVAIGSVVPVIGTAVGGVVGGVAGSLAGGISASAGSKALLDQLVEDDAKQMLAVLQEVVAELGSEYLLSKAEVDQLLVLIKDKIDAAFLRRMYASSDAKAHARKEMEPHFKTVISKRPLVSGPSAADIQRALEEFEQGPENKAPERTEKSSRMVIWSWSLNAKSFRANFNDAGRCHA